MHKKCVLPKVSCGSMPGTTNLYVYLAQKGYPVVENRRTLLLKEGVGGLNEFTLHRIIYIYINSCIKVFVYKQKRGILCGSPSYAAASCTSLVEYLARGLWGRLHLHNSTESLSLSLPPLMCLYLARSCGDTCVGKAIKTLPLRKAELHFLSRSRETLIRATAVKIVQ